MTQGADAAALTALRSYLEQVVHIHGVLTVLRWDRETYMPPGGAATRAEQVALLERLAHERMLAPELDRLIEQCEAVAPNLDADSDDARLVLWARRDHEKAVRVPADLAEDLARASTLGQSAWLAACESGDFGRFRDALASQIELSRRYAACFPDAAHPYDALLDDYEPGLTVAQLQPLMSGLSERLAPLVASAKTDVAPTSTFAGPLPIPQQRAAVLAILEAIGFDHATWRLDDAVHPFCRSPGLGDYRITTRYRENDLSTALYSALHELGHGLYDAGVDPRLAGTPLHAPISLGIHESQSRLWENVIGRGRPFVTWLFGRLSELLPAAVEGRDADSLYRALNGVRPSLIRIEADETTYNLHIALRFDLELRLFEGRLEVDDLAGAWNEGMHRLLGVEVPDDVRGVLQDVHWGTGAFGYFPTYTLGNLIGVQLWERARADVPDMDDRLARGDFDTVREWLRINVHAHGRKLMPRDLLRRVTGQELSAEPFLAYLEGKLADAGLLEASRSMPATS